VNGFYLDKYFLHWRTFFFYLGGWDLRVIFHLGKYGIKQAMFTPAVIIQSGEALLVGSKTLRFCTKSGRIVI
jgi:hypothetical protein